jgi:tetratricopeptide (TPR) repeat protein
LVAADPSNPTAWYNLALVCAWNADNDRSIEALERYVGLEDDFDAAARAWDLCELLRCGEGASISSDFEQFGAIYQVVDPRRLSELLASCPHVRMVVLTNGEPYGMQWLDPPEPQGSEPVPLIGRQPRHLAWLRLILRELLGVMSMSESDLQTVQQKLDPLIAPAAKPVKSFRARAAPEQFLSDLVMSVPSRESVDAEPVAVRVQKYFEERWIHEPLRALGGRAPVDAAGNKVLQRKLEGVIRFRERLVAGHGIDYDFGRLRALLGLVPGPRATQAAAVDSPSVGQQCAPAPGSLSDEDLLAAYRAAGTRTIARETLDLGIEMIRRESLATQTDMIAVFRRLIADAIGNERLDDALRLVDDGLGYDARFYSARNRCALEALRAKIFLARRQPEAACELFQKLFDEDPNNLDLVAGAVEDFLSAGVFDTARQFAERGLQKAQAQRQGRLQGQFREYLEAASTRR